MSTAQTSFSLYEAQAKDYRLKLLFGHLARLERERLDLTDQMIAALVRDRTEPMTRGQRLSFEDFQRSGRHAAAELPTLTAQLNDDSLYRAARWSIKTELESSQFMGIKHYAHSPAALALAERINANLLVAWELVKPQTFSRACSSASSPTSSPPASDTPSSPGSPSR